MSVMDIVAYNKRRKEMAKSRKVGSTFTKIIVKGKNKGDRVRFRVAPSGKPYPIKVLNDKGNNSTLKNNSGVKFKNKK